MKRTKCSGAALRMALLFLLMGGMGVRSFAGNFGAAAVGGCRFGGVGRWYCRIMGLPEAVGFNLIQMKLCKAFFVLASLEPIHLFRSLEAGYENARTGADIVKLVLRATLWSDAGCIVHIKV